MSLYVCKLEHSWSGRIAEWYGEIADRLSGSDWNENKRFCEDAIVKCEFRSSRMQNCFVLASLFRLSIQEGNLVRTKCGTYRILAPTQDMTEEEFDKNMIDLLKPLPEKFHNFVKTESKAIAAEQQCDKLEEVFLVAKHMVDGLIPLVGNKG